MADNKFDFELRGDDQVSSSIAAIDEAVRNLLPQLDKTQSSLSLGGSRTREGLDDIKDRFGLLARNARDSVQFIGDIVPPLKMVAGLSLGLGGVAKLITSAWSGVKDFGEQGYHITNQAKNLSMTTRSWQELTGAMIENGSAREDAEQGIEGLFNRATGALNGDDNAFVALLQQQGIYINKTRDGVADVAKLIDDMRAAMANLNPAQQAFFASKAGMSADMLNYLRLSTDQAKKLKDQAQRDGLIFSDQDVSNALAFKNQMNQIMASWDGLILKTESWLGKTELVKNSVEEIKQISGHGFDSVTMGNIMGWNSGGSQADYLRRAQGDDAFKKTLTWKERFDLGAGHASGDVLNKIRQWYTPIDRAAQLQQDMSMVRAPQNVVNPLDRALSNTPEQQQLSQLEAQNNLPPGLLDRVWSAESSRGKRLLSPAGAEGPFQFMPDTGRDYGLHSRSDRMDFSKSSDAAARYLSDLLKRFNGDVRKAVAAYNWGPNRVSNKGLGMAPRETREYLEKVMPGLPDIYPQGDTSDAGNAPSAREKASLILNAPPRTESQPVDLSQISGVLSDALKNNKMQVEVTLINPQTGERRTFNRTGPKIATTMNY